MTNQTEDVATKQRRVRLLGAIDQLVERYEKTFSEPAMPRLEGWLKARLEEDKDRAIKDSLSHFEVSELIEITKLIAILQAPPSAETEIAKAIAEILEPDPLTDTPKTKRRGRPKKER